MANGPLGGNMGTPPVPPQPPQVSFETTAQSRGNFNNFLKSIPPTTTMTPLPPMGSAPMMPTPMTPMPPMSGNPMANIDIFNQPMGMMGMNQPPMNPMMQPPMQTPMMMAGGGNVPPRRTDIMGEDHMLAYITPEEGGILQALGGSGTPGPMGIPQFGFGDGDDDGGYGDGDSDTGGGGGGDTDTGGGGGGSDNDGSDNNNDSDNNNNNNNNDDDTSTPEDFDDSTDVGTDPGTGNDGSDNNNNTGGGDPTGGGGGSDIGTSPPDDDVEDISDDVPSPPDDDVEDISDDVETPISVEPVSPISTEPVSPSPTEPISIVGDDPVAGIDFTPGSGVGGGSFDVIETPTVTEAEQQQNIQDAQTFIDTPIAQPVDVTPAGNLAANIVSTYRPQQFGLGLDLDDPLGLGFNTAGLIESARAAQGIRDPEQFTQVASLGNVPSAGIAAITPGAFPTLRPDNLLSLSQGLDVTNPAEMRGLEDAVRDNVQVGLTNDDVDINTPAGQQMEDIETASLMNAVLSGQADAPDGIGDPVDVTTGLDQVFNAPITSAPTVSAPVDQGIVPVGEFNVRPSASNQLSNIDPFEIQPTFQNIGLPGTSNLPNVDSTRSTVAQDQARAIANLVGDRTPTIGEQLQQNILEERGRALGPTTFRDDAADVTFQNIRGQTPTTDTVFDIDTTSIQPTSQSAGVQELLDRGATAQRQRNQAEQDELAAAQSLGVGTSPIDATNLQSRNVMGRDIALPTGAPVDFEEQVGKPYSGVDIDKIEQFYNAPMTFDRLGVPPGMFSTALNFVESKARDSIAADLISGNFDPIYDSDGKITGSRNPRTGQVQSGMDMNAPVDRGDDNPLILKPIAKAKKDEKDDKKEDKPPNVIGGVDPKAPVSSSPTVVDSPFTTNVGDFKPVGFSSGDLNKLIAAITGVASPKSMKKGGVAGFANGGVISAVDNFLATA